MGKMFVIQTGRTTWDDQTRVESVPGAPLTALAEGAVREAARELLAEAISIVYACEGQAERQTAGLIAEALGVKIRIDNELRELDYGLWQGLTREEIKRRQPKLYRQWTESPASVRPPGGETLQEAHQRLRKAMKGILKRHRTGGALIVLRPLARALTRCLVGGNGIESIRQNAYEPCTWDVFEADLKDLEEN